MKILLLITGLGVGGAERQVVDLADTFASMGHEVLLLCLAGPIRLRPNSALVGVESLELVKSPAGLWRASRALQRRLLAFAPDVVHSHLVHANLPMSGIRQGAAIGFMCIAFTAFLDKRLIAFLCWTLAASLFHSSAAVFILLAPVVHGEYSAGRIAMAGLLAVPGALALLTGSDAQLAVSRYVGTGVDSAGAIFRFGLLLATGLFFFVLVRGTWRKRFPQDFSLIALGALLMVGLFPLVFVSTVIGDRIAYYLVPLQAVIFSRFAYLGRGFCSPSMTFAPYLIFGLMLFVWTNNSWHFYECYVPYKTWIFGSPSGSDFTVE